ncbi:MAG: helix-turn-helix domain-containing protein [Acutalibacteraceae bacterium]
MNNEKIGGLILKLRKEQNMTQLQLAEKMNISDKTVSKWERGLGCPDVSLLTDLSKIFGVDLEKLLSGELKENNVLSGDMNKLKFYVCPFCNNLITSLTQTDVSCCGKRLKPIEPVKVDDEHKISVETIENEYFISSDHEMSKEHYIPFVALLTTDTIMIKKSYPEWNLQMRIPVFAHGKLLWYCNKHGLYYQYI